MFAARFAKVGARAQTMRCCPPVSSADPQQHRILLVGPRVVHLKPFFERRRYRVAGVQKGVEGMSALDAEPRDIVILELNLGDLTATEFLMAARQAHAQASFLLLDDATKAGQIVKALQAGLDGYLPTPPDEDRLLFEVERHLRRVSDVRAARRDAFDSVTGETQLSLRPPEHENTDLQTQLADRESQLADIGAQNELLRQEVARLREEGRALASIRQALVGVDGVLDDAQAARIKERLAMATVIETEVDTLREELAASRNVRRELNEQVEQLKRRVEALQSQAAERRPAREGDSVEGPALKAKANELEADNMVLAGRVGELEEEVARAKAEIVVLLRKSSDERAEREEQHRAELVSLREQHEATLERARAEAASTRAAFEARLAESAGDAEKSRRAADREAELQGLLDAASVEKDQAVEKALDMELVVGELQTKIEHLEREVKRQEERAGRTEAELKRHKLRIIEEKEQVALGAQDSFQKLQRFVDENGALRRQNAELAEKLATLERGLAEHMSSVEQRLEDERARAAAVDNTDSDHRLAEAIAAREAAEHEAARSQESVRHVERALTAATTDLEEARQAAARATESIATLEARVASLERLLAQREAAAAEACARAESMEMQADEQRRALADQYEARLREMLETQPAPGNDVVAERDKYRQRLAETETWVQQAQLHLEALHAERDQLTAQASALANDLKARSGETHELYAQLAAAGQHIEALTTRAASMEQELLVARQHASQRPTSSADPRALAQAQEEIRQLRTELQQARARVDGGGRLPEELEPLRWTLTAAIDALTTLEGREPALGAHVRNLRLLATTLQRLSPSA